MSGLLFCFFQISIYRWNCQITGGLFSEVCVKLPDGFPKHCTQAPCCLPVSSASNGYLDSCQENYFTFKQQPALHFLCELFRRIVYTRLASSLLHSLLSILITLLVLWKIGIVSWKIRTMSCIPCTWSEMMSLDLLLDLCVIFIHTCLHLFHRFLQVLMNSFHAVCVYR